MCCNLETFLGCRPYLAFENLLLYKLYIKAAGNVFISTPSCYVHDGLEIGQPACGATGGSELPSTPGHHHHTQKALALRSSSKE